MCSSGLKRASLALGATLVDEMALEVKADDRGEGIDDLNHALDDVSLVAGLVHDVVGESAHNNFAVSGYI